jgi:CheY-like chemotaxis protein
MEARVLELASVVSNAETLLRRLIGEDIEIVTLSDHRLGRVKADPTQIEQVVMNLAINARDAMPGGGRLTIETANVELDEGYSLAHPDVQAGPYVLLAVSDSGTGMSAETLSHIYEPFFTAKEAGRGTGLGLATVYGIVRQSGGHLAVYSEEGHGTSFKIYLPRIEAAVASLATPTTGAEPTLGTETVLLIEDEMSLREVILDQLNEGGYTVVTGENVAGAVHNAERHEGPIHLVITDIVMPGMGGREAVRRIRASRPDIRVIYMSGYSGGAAGAQGLADPDEAFLQKPFSLVGLLRKMREVLDTAPPPSAPNR